MSTELDGAVERLSALAEEVGRKQLEERHRLHVLVRGQIDLWNQHAQVMHMGHKIALADMITEALLESQNHP